MAIAAVLYNDYVSEVSNYAMYAEARLGGNGDPNGAPELVVGRDGEDAAWGRTTWDGDLTDGFDTGDVAHAFGVDFRAADGDGRGTDESGTGGEPDSEGEYGEGETGGGGVAAGQSAGHQPLAFASDARGEVVTKVQVRAVALAAAVVEWSTVTIRFYRDGVLVDAYTPDAGPAVDTSGTPGDTTAEAILEVVPSGADYDEVVVRGTFRMAFDSTSVTPGETDLALQVFVYTRPA